MNEIPTSCPSVSVALSRSLAYARHSLSDFAKHHYYPKVKMHPRSCDSAISPCILNNANRDASLPLRAHNVLDCVLVLTPP